METIAFTALEAPTAAVPLIQPGAGLVDQGSLHRYVAGRYRIDSLLGRGGMGSVWLARDELLDRPVALKSHTAGTKSATRADRERVLNEARTAACVDSSGTVRIHDLVRDDDAVWLVMEPLSGRSLGELIKTEGPLPLDRALDIAQRLLASLEDVHRAGVVHRDVKPANVHLCNDGRVVLTDFGIAAFVGTDAGSEAETLSGSPGFMAPEQVLGGVPDTRSDLFAFGATLYAMVEGHGPFDRGDLSESLSAVLRAEPDRAVRLGPLEPIISGLLARRAEQRLRAEQVQQALSDLRCRGSTPPPAGASQLPACS